MNRLTLAAVVLLAPVGAFAAGAFTALHPEEALPDPTERPSTDPYTGFISKVQEKLRALGFDAGPVNGDFGTKTQAALAQFQLSRTIPASGQLDDPTLAELGVQREEPQASAGPSVVSTEAPKSEPAPQPSTPSAPAGPSAERTAEPKPPGQLEQKPEPKTGEKPGS